MSQLVMIRIRSAKRTGPLSRCPMLQATPYWLTVSQPTHESPRHRMLLDTLIMVTRMSECQGNSTVVADLFSG